METFTVSPKSLLIAYEKADKSPPDVLSNRFPFSYTDTILRSF